MNTLFSRLWDAATPYFAVFGFLCACTLAACVALVIWLDYQRARHDSRVSRARRSPAASGAAHEADRDLTRLLANELPPAPAGWQR